MPFHFATVRRPATLMHEKKVWSSGTRSLSWPIRQGLHPKHGGTFIAKSTVVNVTHFFSGTSAYHYFAIFATNMRLAEHGVINPARAHNT
jgi:hypothetical protein